MFNVAYLALGGKASSKMSRSKMPMGQVLAAAENLALDKAAQQVSANKNAVGQFLFYAEKLALAKNGRLSLYTDLQRAMELPLMGWKSVTTIYFIPFPGLNLSCSLPGR